MARFLHSESLPAFRKWGNGFLALSWCAGLLCGVILYHRTGSSVVSLMRMAVNSRVSIVGLLIPFLLPFLFSAFAVYLFLPQLLTAVCFCKATLLAFISCGILCAYGSAGWLVRLLFMFSDIWCSVLLYGYWTRHIAGKRGFSLAEAGAFFAAACLAAGGDYYCITPFLQGVLGS